MYTHCIVTAPFQYMPIMILPLINRVFTMSLCQFPASSQYVLSVGATQGPESSKPEISCSSDTGTLNCTVGTRALLAVYLLFAYSSYCAVKVLKKQRIFNILVFSRRRLHNQWRGIFQQLWNACVPVSNGQGLSHLTC